MTRLLALFAIAALIWWMIRARIRSRGVLPRRRVRNMRLRLRLRLRPGPGFASLFELWLRWGRFAAFRKSRRIRPSLSAWDRLRNPEEYSSKIGTAQRGHGLRVPHEENILLTGPPRSYKSALLGSLVLTHRGPLLCTSTKADLFAMTSIVRGQQGPVAVFNPAGVADIPSTMRFDPVRGCVEPEVSIRRADAFTNAISMKDGEDGGFFLGKASSYLRAMFTAADLVGGDLRLVHRWVLGSAQQAEQILAAAGADHWAAELGELRGEALKTAATCRMVLARALAFMSTPALAQSVLPGGELDIEGFLHASGTLYLIADSANEENPVAPVFAAIASEWHHVASQAGSKMPGQRLDPPLRMILDEVVGICPIPLPSWMSDSGGRGIALAAACHSTAQLRTRWHADGAQAILSTAGTRIFLAGLADVETVEMISRLSGDIAQKLRGQEHVSEHRAITEAMARSLPPGYAVVLRGGNTVTICRLERAWRQRPYRQAKRRGETMAEITAAQVPALDRQLVPEIGVGADE